MIIKFIKLFSRMHKMFNFSGRTFWMLNNIFKKNIIGFSYIIIILSHFMIWINYFNLIGIRLSHQEHIITTIIQIIWCCGLLMPHKTTISSLYFQIFSIQFNGPTRHTIIYRTKLKSIIMFKIIVFLCCRWNKREEEEKKYDIVKLLW